LTLYSLESVSEYQKKSPHRMAWGDFFMKRYRKKSIREETAFLIQNVGGLFGAAFLSGFVGTLVWVNCRGAWFVMRFAKLPSFAPSLSLSYTSWLICYGIFGAAALYSMLISCKCRRSLLADSGILAASYFFSLLWQPLFYSAHFLFISLLALTAACGLSCVFFFRSIRVSLWLSAAGAFILGFQFFFVVLTVCCF